MKFGVYGIFATDAQYFYLPLLHPWVKIVTLTSPSKTLPSILKFSINPQNLFTILI